MKVAILIPTRKRVKILDKCLKALAKKTKYKDYFVQVIFDGDLRGYSSLDCESYGIEIRKTLIKKQSEYTTALNQAYQEAKDEADLFVAWSDDSFPTSGWLTKAINSFKKNFPEGGGVVSMNHYWGDALCTHGIFDKKFLKAIYKDDSYVLWPEFIHYGGDDLLTALAKKKNLMFYNKNIKVIHPTPAETKKNPSMEYKDRDRSLWITIKSQRGL